MIAQFRISPQNDHNEHAFSLAKHLHSVFPGCRTPWVHTFGQFHTCPNSCSRIVAMHDKSELNRWTWNNRWHDVDRWHDGMMVLERINGGHCNVEHNKEMSIHVAQTKIDDDDRQEVARALHGCNSGSLYCMSCFLPCYPLFLQTPIVFSLVRTEMVLTLGFEQ